jgi:hypothetical protein
VKIEVGQWGVFHSRHGWRAGQITRVANLVHGGGKAFLPDEVCGTYETEAEARRKLAEAEAACEVAEQRTRETAERLDARLTAIFGRSL